MVVLGGLEIIAAGYLINKHVKNKKERARLEDERQQLEEEQYHLFPPSDSRHHHHSRSHSERPDSRHRRDSGRRRRDSDDRRTSRRDSDDWEDSGRSDDDRKHSHSRRHSRERKSRRDHGPSASMSPVPPPYYKAHSVSPRPPVQQMGRPVQQWQQQQPYGQSIPQPVPVINHTPPAPQNQQQYPPDIKYGWTDDRPSSSQNEAQGFPPTGWPAHWEQSQRPEIGAGRGRSKSETRPSNESRVRFNLPNEGEVRPSGPPPKYKA